MQKNLLLVIKYITVWVRIAYNKVINFIFMKIHIITKLI